MWYRVIAAYVKLRFFLKMLHVSCGHVSCGKFHKLGHLTKKTTSDQSGGDLNLKVPLYIYMYVYM